jgi:hypothetical protein
MQQNIMCKGMPQILKNLERAWEIRSRRLALGCQPTVFGWILIGQIGKYSSPELAEGGPAGDSPQQVGESDE